MNRVLTVVILTLLEGCVTTRPFVNAEGKLASEKEVLECDYEATKASAGAINTGFGTGPSMQKAILMQKCMAVKGYKIQ